MTLANDCHTMEDAIIGDPDVYGQVLKLTKDYSGRYLDIGAGQGRLAEKLMEQGHRDIYVCDKHPEFLQIKGLPCARIDLNCEVLPYSDSFFDVITCADVIEHLENPRHLLRESYRALKAKGKLIISTPNNLSLRGRLSFLFRGYTSFVHRRMAGRESAHITMLTRIDLLRILKDTGFKPVKIIYTRGVIPKSHIYWQTLMPLLKGELFADTIILLAEKL